MERVPSTVYIVDDDDAVRDSLSLLMKSEGLRTRCYPSAESFLAEFGPDHYGCLLLDIRMPGMSGMELQRELLARHSMLPIIFITAHGDIPMAVDAVQHGAVDFVQKPFDDTQLLAKVKQSMADSEARHEQDLEQLDIRRRLGTLTTREREVMAQVVKGKANKVIASDLGVSQRTVEIHRARVMEKMQAGSLAHLVRMVLAAESDA
jgi:two-component system response regulator FixJ